MERKKKTDQDPKYEKPLFVKEEGLIFPKEIIHENFNGSQFCFQCSSCHGCQ